MSCATSVVKSFARDSQHQAGGGDTAQQQRRSKPSLLNGGASDMPAAEVGGTRLQGQQTVPWPVAQAGSISAAALHAAAGAVCKTAGQMLGTVQQVSGARVLLYWLQQQLLLWQLQALLCLVLHRSPSVVGCWCNRAMVLLM